MHTCSPSRREAVATALALPLMAASPFTASARQAKTPVRKNIAKLGAASQEVKAYKAAVDKMQKRSKANPKDPLGWQAQAQIHFDSCPHGNWFFLPWHRAYLYYFEAICRQESGDPNFALPYWDWTANPSIPDLFYEAGSVLSHPRDLAKGKKVSDSAVGPAALKRIMRIRDFITFGSGRATALRGGRNATGQLEGVPHNTVHREVGKDMGDFMSPLDPIFWLHHANVDRIWAEWEKAHPGRLPNDKVWRDLKLDTFFDLKGKKVGDKVSEYLDNYSLGYRYDTQPEKRLTMTGATRPIPARPAVSSSWKGAVLTASAPATTIPSVLPPRMALAFRSIRASKEEDLNESARLIVEGVHVPKDLDVSVRVFVNTKANERTPPEGPNFLGAFTFFGTHRTPMKGMHGEKEAKVSFILDLTNSLRSVRAYESGDALQVSLVAVPLRSGWKDRVAIDACRVEWAAEGW